MRAAAQEPPATSGIEMTNWYWKVGRQLVSERFGGSLHRSSCLNYLHRLGFVFKRPNKRSTRFPTALGKRGTTPLKGWSVNGGFIHPLRREIV